MYDCLTSESASEFAFDIVDRIMCDKRILRRTDLGVQRYHLPSGTVVVNYKIMQTFDLFVRKYKLFDLFDEFRFRWLPEERAYRVYSRTYAGIEYKSGDKCAAPSVYEQFEAVCCNKRYEDR